MPTDFPFMLYVAAISSNGGLVNLATLDRGTRHVLDVKSP